jgi:PilZ domain-containing protein
VSLPVRVKGEDDDGHSWQEQATSRDASEGGAAVALDHRVRPGQLLHVSLPLPTRLRRSGLLTPAYQVYALVRWVRATGEIGVLFLDSHPRGYERNPEGLFLHPVGQTAEERRRAQRVDGPFFFGLRREMPDAKGPTEEAAVAENLSEGGARVKSALQLSRGDVIHLRELGGLFRTRAEIRNVYVGPDRVQRANLMFLDEPAPARLLRRH